MKSRSQAWTDFPYLVFLRFLALLFIHLPKLHILQIPQHYLPVYRSSNDNGRVFGIELKGRYLERRTKDQQWVDRMHILVVPEKDERFRRFHRKDHSLIVA